MQLERSIFFLKGPWVCSLFLREPERCLLICLPPVIVNMGGWKGWGGRSPQQLEEIYWSRSKEMTTVIPPFFMLLAPKYPPPPPHPPSVGKRRGKNKEKGVGRKKKHKTKKRNAPAPVLALTIDIFLPYVRLTSSSGSQQVTLVNFHSTAWWDFLLLFFFLRSFFSFTHTLPFFFCSWLAGSQSLYQHKTKQSEKRQKKEKERREKKKKPRPFQRAAHNGRHCGSKAVAASS